MQKHVYLVLLMNLIYISSTNAKGKELQMGGRYAYTIPTNIAKNYEKGFADMSENGNQIGFFGRWFYTKNLSLGWDVAYQYQSEDRTYWDVGNNGNVKGNYQTLQVLAEGNYYFSHDEFRPYAGVSFGAFGLRNMMDFDSSNDQSKPSTSYVYTKVLPGLAPQLGFTLELSKSLVLDVHARMVLIPNLTEEFVFDDSGRQISTNPHGAQNHLSFSVGLLFGM